MNYSSKLKPIKLSMIIINSILFVVIFFSIFAVIRAVLSEPVADKISGMIYIVFAGGLLFFWFRTKSILLLPGMLMNLSVAIHFFFHIRTILIVINVLLLIIMIHLLYVHLKHNSIHRKLLELAASTVTDTKNGYTSRSYPVGKIDFSKGELFGFAEYLKKQLIAVSQQEGNTVVFVLAEDWYAYLLDLRKDDDEVTRIVFNYDGGVSASIAKTDYSKYKEALTFDQLCDSLGNVFMEFLHHFKNGDQGIILERILKNK